MRTASTESRARLKPAFTLRPRASVLLFVASLIGFVAYCWPLFIHQHAGENSAHGADAPWIFVALVPLLLAIIISEISEGSVDAKAVALLGILAACGAALRIPSPGIDGFEPLWFLVILSGRVFGRGFGFVMGALVIFVSALITGGVGPWLPFEMMGGAWMGLAAGSLPRARGWREIFMLAGFTVVACLLYGMVLNLWFWPFLSQGTAWGFVPGAGPVANLHRFIVFDLTTSLGFDIPRAVTNAVLVLVLGRPVLGALRRVSKRAAFDPLITFGDESPDRGLSSVRPLTRAETPPLPPLD